MNLEGWNLRKTHSAVAAAVVTIRLEEEDGVTRQEWEVSFSLSEFGAVTGGLFGGRDVNRQPASLARLGSKRAELGSRIGCSTKARLVKNDSAQLKKIV